MTLKCIVQHEISEYLRTHSLSRERSLCMDHFYTLHHPVFSTLSSSNNSLLIFWHTYLAQQQQRQPQQKSVKDIFGFNGA